ncbi:hypothetical protein [Rhabdothermincola sp.]|uniref:hypothetical protein n=1 Tax=Rhabdothermincola sp. TaxID=2820405 RepID=UPI002FE2BE3B
MTVSSSPLAIGLVAAGLAVAVVFLAFLTVRGVRRRGGPSTKPRLPQGADAALWSIIEAVPDPRNHLALTRDLSGEVRITDTDRAMAAAAASATATARPVRQARERAAARPHIDGRPVIELRDRDAEERQARENLELTAQLFFAEEPRLSRF